MRVLYWARMRRLSPCPSQATCGEPTVAYRQAGGVTEAINEAQTGLLVDSYEELRTVVRGLLQSPAELHRMGERAKERSTRFTWRETTDAVEAALREGVSECRR